ncbi:MAG: hypothetical protein RL065_936 [Bacteroidota bacterium]|jgi:UMF1 family MFS transporter
MQNTNSLSVSETKNFDNPKIIKGWAMYDWANSVYNLVITSTIFPAYYEGITSGNNGNVVLFERTFVNTALYNYVLAFAFLIVALLSPILSSIADYKGNKKSFLRFFSTLGSISCSMLFFFTMDNFIFGLVFVILACIGFWSSLVFYNSYLPEIASEQKRDDVSAKGFTYGYIGSVLLQVLCFVVVFKKEWFGIDAKNEALPAQISFIMVGIWWFGFAQIPLSILPKGSSSVKEKTDSNLIKNGFSELKKVWNELQHKSVLKTFLFSYFFYNMGVQTVMLVATLFGKKVLHLPTEGLIITILLIQIVAIPGAILIAKLSDKIGNIKTLISVIIFWMLILIAAYFIKTANQFYILGAFVGFVMGGIQSLSRSTYSKMIPTNNDTTSFFSFFDVTEKVAIVVGLLCYGYIEELTGSMQNSILAVIGFFGIGLLILIPIRNKNLS